MCCKTDVAVVDRGDMLVIRAGIAPAPDKLDALKAGLAAFGIDVVVVAEGFEAGAEQVPNG